MAPQFRVDQAIGNYVITAVLGEGGMGEVYLALHPQIGRRLAIKVLAQHLAHMPGFAERFMVEAQVLSRIRHPNVVDVYDFGQTAEGQVYYLMDYLEGRELAEIMSERGAMPAADVIPYALQLCAGLQAAHDVGVIHRDLKPQNIFVLSEAPPTLKILDFGIAKLVDKPDGPTATATGVLMGSPATISPEQARGRPDLVTAASDIYSLGAILYWMLAGQPPFMAEVPAVVVAKHITDPAPPLAEIAPTVPPDVARLVDQCLAKDPARRPNSAARLATALRRSSSAGTVELTRPSVATPRRLTDDLQELLQQAPPAAPRQRIHPLGASRPDIERTRPLRHNTTLRSATGEVISVTTPQVDVVRIPQRRLSAWLVMGSLAIAATLGAWRLAPMLRSSPPKASASMQTPATPTASVSTDSPRESTPALTAPTVLAKTPTDSTVQPSLASVPPAPTTTHKATRRSRAARKRPAAPRDARTNPQQTASRAEITATPRERDKSSRPGRAALLDAGSPSAPSWPTTTGVTTQQPASAEHAMPKPHAPANRVEISPYLRLYMRAMESFSSGHHDQALSLAAQAQRTDPTQPGAPKLLGILYMERDAHQLSALHFERYLQLSPNAADARSIRRMLAWLRERKR